MLGKRHNPGHPDRRQLGSVLEPDKLAPVCHAAQLRGHVCLVGLESGPLGSREVSLKEIVSNPFILLLGCLVVSLHAPVNCTIDGSRQLLSLSRKIPT